MTSYEFETTPLDEQCAQLGNENYSRDSILECRVLQRQLIRQFGEPPEGSCFYRKSSAHDFGAYHELVFKFDEDNEEHMTYFLRVDKGFPYEWDDEAFKELEAGDYSLISKMR